MSTIETGIFAILVVMAFAFMLFGFRVKWPLSPFLRFIAIALFFGGAVLLASGVGVQTTRSISDGTKTWTETTPLIPAGGSGVWISYIFVGLAVINLLWIVKEMLEG